SQRSVPLRATYTKRSVVLLSAAPIAWRESSKSNPQASAVIAPAASCRRHALRPPGSDRHIAAKITKPGINNYENRSAQSEKKKHATAAAKRSAGCRELPEPSSSHSDAMTSVIEACRGSCSAVTLIAYPLI